MVISGVRRYVENEGSDAPGSTVYRIVRAQLLATVLAFAACSFFDWVAAYSILSGGAVCWGPGAYVAWRLNRKTAHAGEAVGGMLAAEFGKFALTVALFIAIFVLVEPIDVLVLFATFIALHGFYVLVPLADRYRQTEPEQSGLEEVPHGQ